MRSAFVCLVALLSTSVQDASRNVWEKQYRDRTAVDLAAQFESDRRPVYRHRAEIVKLLELKPGETVVEIGAGSGFLARLGAAAVGPAGRAVATELDPKMVDYMNARASAEGIANFSAVAGRVDETGLPPSSADAVLVVNTFSFFDKPSEMMRSIAGSMKPGGRLLLVDFPASGGEGVSPETVKRHAAAVGLAFIDQSNVVPSHFALRFLKR